MRCLKKDENKMGKEKNTLKRLKNVCFCKKYVSKSDGLLFIKSVFSDSSFDLVRTVFQHGPVR